MVRSTDACSLTQEENASWLQRVGCTLAALIAFPLHLRILARLRFEHIRTSERARTVLRMYAAFVDPSLKMARPQESRVSFEITFVRKNFVRKYFFHGRLHRLYSDSGEDDPARIPPTYVCM
jgi:hypothetical protein